MECFGGVFETARWAEVGGFVGVGFVRDYQIG